MQYEIIDESLTFYVVNMFLSFLIGHATIFEYIHIGKKNVDYIKFTNGIYRASYVYF